MKNSHGKQSHLLIMTINSKQSRIRVLFTAVHSTGMAKKLFTSSRHPCVNLGSGFIVEDIKSSELMNELPLEMDGGDNGHSTRVAFCGYGMNKSETLK